jgi:hypothetical protein
MDWARSGESHYSSAPPDQGPTTLDHMPSVMEFEHGMLKKPTLHSSLMMTVIMRQDTFRLLTIFTLVKNLVSFVPFLSS